MVPKFLAVSEIPISLGRAQVLFSLQISRDLVILFYLFKTNNLIIVFWNIIIVFIHHSLLNIIIVFIIMVISWSESSYIIYNHKSPSNCPNPHLKSHDFSGACFCCQLRSQQGRSRALGRTLRPVSNTPDSGEVRCPGPGEIEKSAGENMEKRLAKLAKNDNSLRNRWWIYMKAMWGEDGDTERWCTGDMAART